MFTSSVDGVLTFLSLNKCIWVYLIVWYASYVQFELMFFFFFFFSLLREWNQSVNFQILTLNLWLLKTEAIMVNLSNAMHSFL